MGSPSEIAVVCLEIVWILSYLIFSWVQAGQDNPISSLFWILCGFANPVIIRVIFYLINPIDMYHWPLTILYSIINGLLNVGVVTLKQYWSERHVT